MPNIIPVATPTRSETSRTTERSRGERLVTLDTLAVAAPRRQTLCMNQMAKANKGAAAKLNGTKRCCAIMIETPALLKSPIPAKRPPSKQPGMMRVGTTMIAINLGFRLVFLPTACGRGYSQFSLGFTGWQSQSPATQYARRIAIRSENVGLDSNGNPDVREAACAR